MKTFSTSLHDFLFPDLLRQSKPAPDTELANRGAAATQLRLPGSRRLGHIFLECEGRETCKICLPPTPHAVELASGWRQVKYTGAENRLNHLSFLVSQTSLPKPSEREETGNVLFHSTAFSFPELDQRI